MSCCFYFFSENVSSSIFPMHWFYLNAETFQSRQSAVLTSRQWRHRCHQRTESKMLLAGDQWWPHTSGGRLRSARAITYLLRHRISNKRNLHKERLVKFSVRKAKGRQFPLATHMLTSRHFLGLYSPSDINN